MCACYVDAHLHLQDPRFDRTTDELVERAREAGVGVLYCNAISENDWQVVADLAAAHREVVAFLGIHPWFSESATAGWQQRLLGIADAVDKVTGIGETGLDRSCRIDFALQQRLFAEHLELAAERRWPLAVHCVRAWGPLVEQLTDFSRQRPLPPTLVHSFNGSTEIMKRLSDLGCYLSYSEALAGKEQSKLRETFIRTPRSRLLLETDAPYAKNPERKTGSGTAVNEPADVAALYHFAARLLQVETAELTAQLYDNAKIFTNPHVAGQ